MGDNHSSPPDMHLWVVEATLDFPVHVKTEPGVPLAAIYVSLGGEDPDGFVQMRPLDHERATTSTFWSSRQPLAYECRGLIRAPDAPSALLRGKELFEHVADRLTLLSGYPMRVLSVGYVYDEDMLRGCIAGELVEYQSTTAGEEVFRTQLPKNAHLPQLLNPPEAALEAIRWFRLGLSAARKPDQYLSYYIALESIAKHVPGVTRGPRRNSAGEEEAGLETQENAAIKHLISRYPQLPLETKKTLATIRARIAHGKTDLQTLHAASANLPLVQRLAADGIALVCGVDPAQFNVLQPSPIDLLAPLLRSPYSVEHDPARRWGGLLSDAFAKYLEGAKHLAGQQDTQGPSNSALQETPASGRP